MLGEHDVICGRSKVAFNHPGNKNFRKLVRQYGTEYQKAQLRAQKNSIAKKVIDLVRKRGGKFLVSTDPDGKDVCCKPESLNYVEASYECMYEKVSHALRSVKAKDLLKEVSPKKKQRASSTLSNCSSGSASTSSISQSSGPQGPVNVSPVSAREISAPGSTANFSNSCNAVNQHKPGPLLLYHADSNNSSIQGTHQAPTNLHPHHQLLLHEPSSLYTTTKRVYYHDGGYLVRPEYTSFPGKPQVLVVQQHHHHHFAHAPPPPPLQPSPPPPPPPQVHEPDNYATKSHSSAIQKEASNEMVENKNPTKSASSIVSKSFDSHEINAVIGLCHLSVSTVVHQS